MNCLATVVCVLQQMPSGRTRVHCSCVLKIPHDSSVPWIVAWVQHQTQQLVRRKLRSQKPLEKEQHLTISFCGPGPEEGLTKFVDCFAFALA